jgi:cellulose synthase/poly-beta-1,6-N-acetylglucosamine synthase-like glycosyltransferase
MLYVLSLNFIYGSTIVVISLKEGTERKSFFWDELMAELFNSVSLLAFTTVRVSTITFVQSAPEAIRYLPFSSLSLS